MLTDVCVDEFVLYSAESGDDADFDDITSVSDGGLEIMADQSRGFVLPSICGSPLLFS